MCVCVCVQIVWDPVKKKWMNKDGEEDDSAVAGPPPTDTDLMSMTAVACCCLFVSIRFCLIPFNDSVMSPGSHSVMMSDVKTK